MSIFLILYILKNIQCACTSTNFVEDFASQQSWEQGTTFPIPIWLLFAHVDNLPTYLSPPEWAFVTTDEATRTVNKLFSLPLCFSFRDVHSIPLDKCIITCVHHNSLTQITSRSWKFSRFRIFRVPPLKPMATTDLFNLFYISYYFPRWLSGKKSITRCRTSRWCRFDPWVRKIPWRKKWKPTPVSFPGKSMDRGAWQATAPGLTKTQIQLSTYEHLPTP